MKFTGSLHTGLCEKHPQEQVVSHDEGASVSLCLACNREKEEIEARKQQQIKREEDRLLEISNRVNACRIPYRFFEKSFDDYSAISSSQKANLEKCKQYASEFTEHYQAGRCLILSGTVGTGKTHLAIAILRHVVEQKSFSGKYWAVNTLLQTIRSSYEKDSGYSESDVIESVVETDLLVIDEIGATKQSEFELATLFNIINCRYERQVPTIVISNLGPKQIGEAIGERCFDRLREGGGECLVFQGESNRKK